jgi:hypothetical protein
MRHLLRCLALSALLVPALMAQPSTREACTNGDGSCSISGAPCATNGQCGSGQTCICNS